MGGRGASFSKKTTKKTEVTISSEKDIPENIKQGVNEAKDYYINELGININDITSVVIDEKREQGLRTHYAVNDDKVHIFRTEINKGEYDNKEEASSTLVHEFAHAVEHKFIYNNKLQSKYQETQMKAFISDVSKRSGIKLTQAKIRDLYGNYATKDKNREFISMSTQWAYDHRNSTYTGKIQTFHERRIVANAVLEELKRWSKK